MNDDAAILEFRGRDEFREWLAEHHERAGGIWISFVKGSKLFTANDALEEAICFGWIDGLMKSIDERNYRKYFSRRKDAKKWSDKNKAIYVKLMKAGLVTRAGIEAHACAEGAAKPGTGMDEKLAALKAALKSEKDALALLEGKAPSRQKQFAGFYFDAKTEATRGKRKSKIVEALRSGYSGMLY